MGLIDILTQYDAKKKAAHAAKTVKHGVRVPLSLSFLGLTLEREPLVSEQQLREDGSGEGGGHLTYCSLFLLTGGGRDLDCPS